MSWRLFLNYVFPYLAMSSEGLFKQILSLNMCYTVITRSLLMIKCLNHSLRAVCFQDRNAISIHNFLPLSLLCNVYFFYNHSHPLQSRDTSSLDRLLVAFHCPPCLQIVLTVSVFSHYASQKSQVPLSKNMYKWRVWKSAQCCWSYS